MATLCYAAGLRPHALQPGANARKGRDQFLSSGNLADASPVLIGLLERGQLQHRGDQHQHPRLLQQLGREQLGGGEETVHVN